MPIVIMLMSKEAYGFLAGSMMGKIALAVNMFIVFFLATRVEKIANYNPTERGNKVATILALVVFVVMYWVFSTFLQSKKTAVAYLQTM